MFSRGALESYLPRLQDVVKSEIAKWCLEPGAVDVYKAARSLTFRIAIGVLLGLQLEEERIVYLAQIFEQLMNNLFSLPIDAPLSGLRKVREYEETSATLLKLKSTYLQILWFTKLLSVDTHLNQICLTLQGQRLHGRINITGPMKLHVPPK